MTKYLIINLIKIKFASLISYINEVAKNQRQSSVSGKEREKHNKSTQFRISTLWQLAVVLSVPFVELSFIPLVLVRLGCTYHVCTTSSERGEKVDKS